MQFLKTLFWVLVAVALVLFSDANWAPMTVNLWGGLQADVKLPVLLLIAFLAGLLPMLIVHRARLWTLNRRLEAHERQAASIVPLPAPIVAPERPSILREEDRIATDAKAWPKPSS